MPPSSSSPCSRRPWPRCSAFSWPGASPGRWNGSRMRRRPSPRAISPDVGARRTAPTSSARSAARSTPWPRPWSGARRHGAGSSRTPSTSSRRRWRSSRRRPPPSSTGSTRTTTGTWRPSASRPACLRRVVDDLRTISLAEAGVLPCGAPGPARRPMTPPPPRSGRARRPRAWLDHRSRSGGHSPWPRTATGSPRRSRRCWTTRSASLLQAGTCRWWRPPRPAGMARLEVPGATGQGPVPDLPHVFDRPTRPTPAGDRGPGPRAWARDRPRDCRGPRGKHGRREPGRMAAPASGSTCRCARTGLTGVRRASRSGARERAPARG